MFMFLVWFSFDDMNRGQKPHASSASTPHRQSFICHHAFTWKATKPKLIKSSQRCKNEMFALWQQIKKVHDIRTGEQEEKVQKDQVGCRRNEDASRLRGAGFTAELWLTGERLGEAAAAAAAVFPLLAVSLWCDATGISLFLCCSFSLCLWSCCRDRSWVWSLGRVRWDLLPAEGCWCWARGWDLACDWSRDCECWALRWSSWFGATALYVANMKSRNTNWQSLEVSFLNGVYTVLQSNTQTVYKATHKIQM